jgi:excisionase family DNA binding protein
MNRRPADLPRIAAALRRLDELAAEHPHLIAPMGHPPPAVEDWLATLNEVEAMPKTYSTEELAELIGIHPETLRKEIRAGRLKAATVGRVIRISEPEAAAWWAEQGGGQLFEVLPKAGDL